MKNPMKVVELVVLLLTGFFLFTVLSDTAIAPSPVRATILENGSRDTGALNLVTSIYLGYRAFDTLGETMVLLISVSGVVYFLKREKDEEENNDS